ncbi:MAG TPA: sialate O-acetylesterase, partial [Flavisolibacter sp.]|nr:sialate O-acetylesterase [Flavisolibacter sp.]
NMAGRGLVEPEDTIPVQRILTIDRNNRLILAQEPLHFYEPTMAGLDCGYSFAKTLVRNLPDSVEVLLIPTAVGGSSISQWLGDSVYRNVRLFSNFKEKVEIARQYGTIKAVLWHQGESDANPRSIPLYQQRLGELVARFRSVTGNHQLPVLLGELGRFSKDKENWQKLNAAIQAYVSNDSNTAVIKTGDLKDKGDSIHFNSKGQRLMGERFAKAFLSMTKASP